MLPGAPPGLAGALLHALPKRDESENPQVRHLVKGWQPVRKRWPTPMAKGPRDLVTGALAVSARGE
jgi:hypothetical protein